MKILKIIIIPIFIALVFQYNFYQPKTAQAVSYKKINWLAFENQLEDYLWSYRAKTGYCLERNPFMGECISSTNIIEILDQLTDPNGDGNFNDMYFKIADPTARLQYLTTAESHSYYLKTVVYFFEKSRTVPLWIVNSNISGDQIYSVSDDVLGRLARTFQLSGAIQPFDSELLAFAFEPTGEVVNNVNVLRVQPKTTFTQGGLDLIYATSRMDPFAANRNLKDWTSSEIDAFNTLNRIQKAIFEQIQKNSTVTPSMARQVSRSIIQESQLGGIAILKGVAPLSSSQIKIGLQTINITDFILIRMFMYSETSSIAVRYQRVVQSIADGANIIVKTDKTYMNDVDVLLSNAVRDSINIASKEKLYDQCENRRAAGCFHPSTKDIFYLDYYLSPNNGSVSLVSHEMFHYLRDVVRQRGNFSDNSGLFDEAFTDWMTKKSVEEAGAVFDNFGYEERWYMELINSRIGKQDQSLAKNGTYLKSIFFQKSYSMLDTYLNKPNYYETINDLLAQQAIIENQYEQAVGNNTPDKQTVLNQWNAKKDEIVNYITK